VLPTPGEIILLVGRNSPPRIKLLPNAKSPSKQYFFKQWQKRTLEKCENVKFIHVLIIKETNVKNNVKKKNLAVLSCSIHARGQFLPYITVKKVCDVSGWGQECR
jgi:hypothetical protein